jgi:nucleoside-diphosphate-sugar epimerase
MDWSGRRVLVTGGASFIGSHLVDARVGVLVDRYHTIDRMLTER